MNPLLPESHRSPRIPRLEGYPGISSGESTRHRRGQARWSRRSPALALVLLIVLVTLLFWFGRAGAENAIRPAQMRSLFKQLDASVVTVSSAHVVDHSDVAAGWESPAFREFMRTHLQAEGGNFLNATVGSGFVISADGLIVTAAHVLQDSVSILVELHDHRLLPADIVGVDFDADVALIKIQATKLVPVRFGAARRLMLGDVLWSIGAPFGLAHTLSTGMVSGARRVTTPEARTMMIQSDLPVNPGSSGSPLFDRQGLVVGMNTIIFTFDGGFNGVSLAVPEEIIQAAVDRIRRGVPPTRGIGVRFRDLPPILGRVLGIERSAVIVTEVDEERAAGAGGLQVGDVVLECDGKAVTSAVELLSALAGKRGDGPLRLKIVREKETGLVLLPLDRRRM